MEIVVARDAHDAAELAAARIARRLRAAIRRRGSATIAFSGGSTPALMIGELARSHVPWAHLRVFQVDERVAPAGDPDRNLALLDPLPIAPRQLMAMPVGDRNLVRAADRYARALPPCLDVVHLGLGDDGHTASWAPGDPVIDAPGLVGLAQPYHGHSRMTITPAVVNAARWRVVLVAGASKAPAVERWLLRDMSLPVSRVRRVDTLLVLDAAAAARLPRPDR